MAIKLRRAAERAEAADAARRAREEDGTSDEIIRPAWPVHGNGES
jgi:hypothetical protein